MILSLLTLSYLLSSCGSGDSDGDSGFATGTQSIFSFDLSDASEGQQYVVMPFVLGDTSSIDGKTSVSAGSYTMTSSSSSLLGLKSTLNLKIYFKIIRCES